MSDAEENKELTGDPLAMQLHEWKHWAASQGLPSYRARQVFTALQRDRARDWNEVHQLRPANREQLELAYPLRWPRVTCSVRSGDGTIRHLLELADGKQVEAVYLPDEEFDQNGRAIHRRTTFCVSSQVGCAVDCQFCLTATLGLSRSLTAGEIVGQVQVLLREHALQPGSTGGRNDRVNLVFMGQGEPFLNYANVVRAIQVLTDPEGAGLAPRRITVSTSGIVDKIRRWSTEPFPHGRPRLAISLNASHDEQRQRLMPLHDGQGGMTVLFDAVDAYQYQPREYLTFEYVLLAGINDQPEDAGRLIQLLRHRRAKVNLIAWNAGENLPFQTPEPDVVLAFQQHLIRGGVPTYLRRPRGRDIFAACGQLSAAGLTAPATTRRNTPAGVRTSRKPSPSSPSVTPSQSSSTTTDSPRA
ncbi:MAG: 23S rRNA (adenine(2503)-C(2))-methyltransferase RlmN [Terriglobales bacterium]